MDVSVIVVLDAAPEAALQTLTAVAELHEDPPFAVVVVDNASVGLEHLTAGLEGDVWVVRLEQRVTPEAARQAGVQAAPTDVVVVLDGMVCPPPDLLRHLLSGGLPATTADHRALAYDRRTPPLRIAPVALTPAARPAPHLPGGLPELSIVVPTLDATSDRTRRCLRALQQNTDVAHELIVVDNGNPPQGFSAPVNAGLRAARGAYAVVCNDDVEVLPGWWTPLQQALDDGAAVVFPYTVDGAMRSDFAAWCFALSRETLESFAVAPGEFLHPDLKVWYQDTDLLQRLRAAGRPPACIPASRIRHGLSETVGTTDPRLRAWIDAQIRADKERFELLHGTGVSGAAH